MNNVVENRLFLIVEKLVPNITVPIKQFLKQTCLI